MKIGLICPYDIAKGGGVLEIVLATKAELEKRGHEVKILTPLHRENKHVNPDDVIFVGSSTDFKSPTHTSVQLSATSDGDKIDEMLAEEQFDILHFHEPWVPMISRQILVKSTSVNIATFHAKVPETIMSRTLAKVVTPYLRSVLKYLHELTAGSESAAEYVRGLTDDPISLIPCGVDLNKYVLKNTHKPGGKTILYVGRLERRKGVKYLLMAFQTLQQTEPDAKLIIAGNGPDREKLEMLADDLKLTNVSFLGFISEELKLQLLSEADIFCSPALFGESFGVVLLEAMAAGAVVVAGNNSGYTEVLKDAGALSLINPQDTAEFARRLHLLLHEEALRKVWLDWAQEYVKQFDWPRVVDKYEALYVESLKRHVIQD